MMAGLESYYSNLLIAQYRSKPRAKAHVEATVKPVLMDDLPSKILGGFDLETAVGVQLDVIGKYVGAERIVVGPNATKVSLNDDDFRVLIKLSVMKNNSPSTLYDIQVLLAEFFNGKILITDNATMQLNYFITEDIGSSNLQYAIVYGGFLPKPMAVQVAAVVVPPLAANYFGFRTYLSAGSNISPFNSYSFYNLSYPWLSYQT